MSGSFLTILTECFSSRTENVLNTISCVCREDSEKARELLLVLANYFRYDLRFESYLVPLEEEINHVQDYLEIEKARFEEKLTVSYEIDADVTTEIPTLILQPIVENAVRYGIDSRGNRAVDIQILETETDVQVWIRDRGKGSFCLRMEGCQEVLPIARNKLKNLRNRLEE